MCDASSRSITFCAAAAGRAAACARSSQPVPAAASGFAVVLLKRFGDRGALPARHGDPRRRDYLAMVIGMPMRETSVTVTWNSS